MPRQDCPKPSQCLIFIPWLLLICEGKTKDGVDCCWYPYGDKEHVTKKFLHMHYDGDITLTENKDVIPAHTLGHDSIESQQIFHSEFIRVLQHTTTKRRNELYKAIFLEFS